MLRDQERRGLVDDASRFLNDRARIMYALELTLTKLGLGDEQIATIIADVRKANFSSIKKAMKIDDTTNV